MLHPEGKAVGQGRSLPQWSDEADRALVCIRFVHDPSSQTALSPGGALGI